MGTMADKFQYLANTKALIKNAIVGKGQAVSTGDTFRSYATKISNISSECTAVASNILSGKTAYSGGSKITGTIASKAAEIFAPSTVARTITAGQYLSGAQTISAVTGNTPVEYVIAGWTFSSANGIGLTGTMPNIGAVASTIATQGGQYSVPAGYHWGTGKVTASFPNLVAGNIKSGVNVGGVVGTLEGVPQRTINITNPYPTTVAYYFGLWGGNSKLVNINNVALSNVPTTVNTYGDILVLYTEVYGVNYKQLVFGWSSGATSIGFYSSTPSNRSATVQVIKLDANTVNLTLNLREP